MHLETSKNEEIFVTLYSLGRPDANANSRQYACTRGKRHLLYEAAYNAGFDLCLCYLFEHLINALLVFCMVAECVSFVNAPECHFLGSRK